MPAAAAGGQRLLPANDGRFDVGLLMLRLARGLDLPHRRGGRVAAFREDDVAGHQLLRRTSGSRARACRWPRIRLTVAAASSRAVRAAGARRRAQARQPVRRGLQRRRRLAEPEIDALAGGDVRLLANARVHQRIAGVAGMLVERAQRCGSLAVTCCSERMRRNAAAPIAIRARKPHVNRSARECKTSPEYHKRAESSRL